MDCLTVLNGKNLSFSKSGSTMQLTFFFESMMRKSAAWEQNVASPDDLQRCIGPLIGENELVKVEGSDGLRNKDNLKMWRLKCSKEHILAASELTVK